MVELADKDADVAGTEAAIAGSYYIGPVIARRHIAKVKRGGVHRPQRVWADLLLRLVVIAERETARLTAHYDGRGTAEGYLWRYLPKRCAQPFYEATGQMLFETACSPYEEEHPESD